jgi:hypothetical protein
VIAARMKARVRWESPALVDAWLVTFTDLLTLLVTLFVLFLSMSAFRQGFVVGGPNPLQSEGTAHTPGAPGDLLYVPEPDIPVAGIGEAGARAEQVRRVLSRLGLKGGYGIFFDGRGMVLRFTDPIVRGDGLAPDGPERLASLAAYLTETGRRVEVTAHAGGRGPDGLKLAARWAEQVAAELVAGGTAPAQVVPVARTRPYADPLDAGGPVGGERVAGDDLDGVVIFVFGDA